METNLAALRAKQRMLAFEECEDAAIRDVLRHPSFHRAIVRPRNYGTASNPDIRVELNPAIVPGMTVRIWATLGLVNTIWERIQSGSFKETYAQHLVAELVSSGQNPQTYSFGYGAESDTKHIFTPDKGVIATPDYTLYVKIRTKQIKPDASTFKLVAIGLLKEHHIEELQRFVSSASIKKYDDKSYEIATPHLPTYRLLSFACPITASHKHRNCTSFIEGLFDDLLKCRNIWGIADPNVCKALQMDDENFGGCTSAGQLWKNEEAQLQNVMQEMAQTSKKRKNEKAQGEASQKKRRAAHSSPRK